MGTYEKRLVHKIAQNTGKRKANKISKHYDQMECLYMLTEKGQRTLKIGYTNDINKRLNQYRTHSTCFEVLDVIPGTYEDEHYYHGWLERLGFEKHYYWGGAEWYDFPENMPKARMKNGFVSLENLIGECAVQMKLALAELEEEKI